MPHSLPGVKELFGAPLRGAGNPNHDEHTSAVALVEQKDALVKAATEATISGLSGETYFGNNHESGAPMIAKRDDKRAAVRKALEELEMAKSVDPAAMAALNAALTGAKSAMLSKEWTLSNPVSTGLVPFDLEQPARLLASVQGDLGLHGHRHWRHLHAQPGPGRRIDQHGPRGLDLHPTPVHLVR